MAETYRDIAPDLISKLQAELKAIKGEHQTFKESAAKNAMDGNEEAFSKSKMLAQTHVLACEERNRAIEWLMEAQEIPLPDVNETPDAHYETKGVLGYTDLKSLSRNNRHHLSTLTLDASVIDTTYHTVRVGPMKTTIERWEMLIHSYAIYVQMKKRFNNLSMGDFYEVLDGHIYNESPLLVRPDRMDNPECGVLCGYEIRDARRIIMHFDGGSFDFQAYGYAILRESQSLWIKERTGWRHLLIPTK